MRAMVVAAGFGVFAVGVVLGLVVSGLTPDAEAAPKQQEAAPGGRLIELGTAVGVTPGNKFVTPMVDVSDCLLLRVMMQGSVAAGPTLSKGSSRTWTSPDGVVRIPVSNDSRDTLAGEADEASTSTFTVDISGILTPAYDMPFIQFELGNSPEAGAVTQDITAWIWCAFN